MADNYMTFNDAVEVLTPYAEKINTIKPESITWAAYQSLTSEQRAAKRYLITDYPSPTGYVNKLSDLEDVSINSQTLADGQVPVYDATGQVWENKTILENSLTSTATDKALTAAKGKELQDNKQDKTLATPITINGTQETTVEGALGGLNDYGDALADNLAANENVYGAKNRFNSQKFVTITGLLSISYNGDGTFAVSGTPTGDSYGYFEDFPLDKGKYILSGIKNTATNIKWLNVELKKNGSTVQNISISSADDTAIDTTPYDFDTVRISIGRISNNVACSGTVYPMIRDVRILDDTFVPYAKTNKQLTDDKAERNDLSTIHATGRTNNTGAQIDAGTFFYLNGQFCKALTNIAANATFTENTNYKKDTVGSELKDIISKQIMSDSVTANTGTYGNVDLGINAGGIALVDAYTTEINCAVIPFYSASKWFVHVVQYTDYTAVVNTDVTVYFRYIKLV